MPFLSETVAIASLAGRLRARSEESISQAVRIQNEDGNFQDLDPRPSLISLLSLNYMSELARFE